MCNSGIFIMWSPLVQWLDLKNPVGFNKRYIIVVMATQYLDLKAWTIQF